MKSLFKNHRWWHSLCLGQQSLTIFFLTIFILSALGRFFWHQSLSSNSDHAVLHLNRFPGSVAFQVEVASTPQALAQGLMNRPHLDQNTGMLFAFPTRQKTKFWMKDTYLALDLIFMDENFKVVQLYANAQPLDLKKIESDQPIKYVLEISAGSIQHHSIRKGDSFKIE